MSLEKIAKDLADIQKAQEEQFSKAINDVASEEQKKILQDAFAYAKTGRADTSTLIKMLQKIA